MHKLFLDIETLPADEEKKETLKILFDKKHDEFSQEKFDDFLVKTSFDGAYGRILCIGYAVDDEKPKNFYNENNEKKTLQEFWDLVNALSIAPRNVQYPDYGLIFVGHNVMDFDLRFIYQRSIVLGVKPAYEINFARYRNYPIFDTMKEWVKWSNNGVGLEYLALALGVPSPKDGIDGSQVAEFYKQGKINDILEYCKRDVETAREIYKKMTFEKTSKTLF
ncbi:MAG TPA: ribonuclease H-like domain-containing protein [Candidatus Moranbacteria bacterium]|nr:ribonuclease H-like domain-containing protein [Candidatus Moranbacteria bacterium]HRZ33397.1 ribonuclease H-like domain-containing protein [Candidatus Moranbacteria bacterium]